MKITYSNLETDYAPSALPNKLGFQFVAVLKQGGMVVCEVVKHADGGFTVDGAAYADIKQWMTLAAFELIAPKLQIHLQGSLYCSLADARMTGETVARAIENGHDVEPDALGMCARAAYSAARDIMALATI